MKTRPKRGEGSLIHETENTGHIAEFGLTPDNYDPAAVHAAWRMLKNQLTIAGFLLRPEDEGFSVWVTEVIDKPRNFKITTNKIKRTKDTIHLVTKVLNGAAHVGMETMQAAADLEQCAAIAIAFEGEFKKAN